MNSPDSNRVLAVASPSFSFVAVSEDFKSVWFAPRRLTQCQLSCSFLQYWETSKGHSEGDWRVNTVVQGVLALKFCSCFSPGLW